MILRHNPLLDNHDDFEAMVLCGKIAMETAHAVVAYIRKTNCVAQLGHFATTTLVECICHLIPSIAIGFPHEHREAALNTIVDSQQLLNQISVHRGAAKRAARVMAQVFNAVSRLASQESLQDEDALRGLFDVSLGAMEGVEMTRDNLAATPFSFGSLEAGGDWLLDYFCSE